jgi:hypothetical protein
MKVEHLNLLGRELVAIELAKNIKQFLTKVLFGGIFPDKLKYATIIPIYKKVIRTCY